MRLIRLSYFLLIFLVLSCTDEPNETNFNVSIQNSTENLLEIRAYLETENVFTVALNPGDNGPSCNYIDENFRGIFLNNCGIDSLVMKFNNDKGYISTDTNSGNFNFSKMRNPLLANGGFQNKRNIYEFLITQEDFENAFELPE